MRENGKIHYIMPMGGGGTRFGNHNFELPKPLIPICGKPFFYWAAESILQDIAIKDLTFVILKDHDERFGLAAKIREEYPDAQIVMLDHVLNGAVLTCLEGVKGITDDAPILFNDCDHFFRCTSLARGLQEGSLSGISGALLTFRSDNPAYSYAKSDDDGFVTETVEKKVVSNDAICGAYWFSDADTFRNAATAYLENCAYDEFFMSGVYNTLAASKAKIVTYQVDYHVSFGTPDEYELAKGSPEFEAYLRRKQNE